jgi:hypothetical protein
MAHRSRRGSRRPRGGFAGFVTTQDHGLLEFPLVFTKEG